MRQGWIIAWNGGEENTGGWVNKVAYADAAEVVQSLIEQGIDPAQIVVNKCGIDHYSALDFLREYGGHAAGRTKSVTASAVEQASQIEPEMMVEDYQEAGMAPAVAVLKEQAKKLVRAWKQCYKEIEKRLAEPDKWLMPHAVDDLKAEKTRIEQTYASVRRAIALLSGEAPIYIHHFEFGADQQISLHLTEDDAIQDVQDTWTQNEFDPETDGSLIFKATLNGGAATPCWVLGEDGTLTDIHGNDLVGFQV